MTAYYVDSHGSDTAPYDTWAKAAQSLATVIAIPNAAGDTIYVAHNHAETGFGSTCNPVSNAANPTRIICGNTSAAPPTALATTASITASTGISFGNTWTYFYGIVFATVGGANSSSLSLSATGQVFDNCTFELMGTSGGNIQCTGNFQQIKNCSFLMSAAGSTITFTGAAQNINSLTMLAGGTSPTTLFGSSSGAGSVVEGLDLTNASSSINLFGTIGSTFVLRNSKMPASWSGSFATTPLPNPLYWHATNVDSSGTNYRCLYADFLGSLVTETTVVRTGGASDGVMPLSWKDTSSSSASYLHPTSTPEFVIWNDATGSAKTVTVEFLHDSVTALKDNEVWLDVTYLGTGGGPVSSLATSMCGLLTTAANVTSSSATWTTTGLTNPNKQKLAVTFTPQLKGFFHARVRLAKASYTCYIDPLLTVT